LDSPQKAESFGENLINHKDVGTVSPIVSPQFKTDKKETGDDNYNYLEHSALSNKEFEELEAIRIDIQTLKGNQGAMRKGLMERLNN